jgi:ribosome silencing factor RsfS/YbeB/iojap
VKETPINDAISSEDFARALAVATLEKKAFDVVLLDMRGLIDFADYFVLCSANNSRQVRAIAESVKLVAKHEHNVHPGGLEGLGSCRWVLVDFSDVVVHVFDGPMRGFYDLDGLWRDAPKLDLPTVEVADEPATLFSLG